MLAHFCRSKNHRKSQSNNNCSNKAPREVYLGQIFREKLEIMPGVLLTEAEEQRARKVWTLVSWIVLFIRYVFVTRARVNLTTLGKSKVALAYSS